MNASEHSEKKGFSALWAVREVDHLFSRFKRYTQFVLYGKWSLGIVALVLMVSLIAWPMLTKDTSGIRVSFVDTKTAAVQKPASPVMENPEYRGVGSKGQQYKVSGLSATQMSPTLVIIDKSEVQILKAKGGWYLLTADRAEYHQDTGIIELFDNVVLVDERSNTFTTSRATIDSNTMDAYGREPVTGNGPLGNIVATGFEIRDNGEHIIFLSSTDPVRVHVDQAKKKE